MQKLSLDDGRASAMKSLSDATPQASTQSPATYENSNIVVFEVRAPRSSFRRSNEG